MSYILDALKKIEHEKNKRNHPDGRVSISGDLFRERNQPAGRTGVWKALALIAAASLVTCAGTWFVLQGTDKKRAANTRQAASVPAMPAVPVPPLPTPVAVQPVAAPVVQKNVGTDEDDDSRARESRHAKKQMKPQQPLSKQPAQTVQAPADIKLSGIAWQDDRPARRAVINGFLLREGAVVSGAKITDIMSDRVRFSSAAGQFEIRLDAVLPAEVQR